MRSDASAGALWYNIQVCFPTIQASSCAQHSLNALKRPGTTVCLPSDHVVQIHEGQCLSNQKTQPTSPWSLTDSSLLFLVEDCISVSTSYPQTHVSSSVMTFLRKFSLSFALASSSWFQHGSLSDRLSSKVARILHWRDASEVSQ